MLFVLSVLLLPGCHDTVMTLLNASKSTGITFTGLNKERREIARLKKYQTFIIHFAFMSDVSVGYKCHASGHRFCILCSNPCHLMYKNVRPAGSACPTLYNGVRLPSWPNSISTVTSTFPSSRNTRVHTCCGFCGHFWTRDSPPPSLG